MSPLTISGGGNSHGNKRKMEKSRRDCGGDTGCTDGFGVHLWNELLGCADFPGRGGSCRRHFSFYEGVEHRKRMQKMVLRFDDREQLTIDDSCVKRRFSARCRACPRGKRSN